MSGQNGQYERETNPWVSRARKFLVTLTFALVILGNSWVDGPAWIYPVAAVASTGLMYLVPNAPKYIDPRSKR